MTNDEKCIIEKGYRQGTLLVLVATSKLSTGINMPAANQKMDNLKAQMRFCEAKEQRP